MKKRLTKKGFIEWLLEQPASQRYAANDCKRCPIGKYMGGDNWGREPRWANNFAFGFDQAVAAGHPPTTPTAISVFDDVTG